MVHYWNLICAGAQIDETTKFFRVAIGTTKQADRDFLFLTAFATSHGYFFEKDCPQVSEFTKKCLLSCSDLPDGAELVPNKIQLVSARNLVRALKAAEALPMSQNQIANFNHVAHFLSLNYRVFSRPA